MSDGSFAFREKAAAALEKAKRIVDLLDVLHVFRSPTPAWF